MRNCFRAQPSHAKLLVAGGLHSHNLFFFAVKLAELRTSACTNGIAAVRTIYDTKD